MGVARIFQRGGHTESNRGYSSDCHLNIVGYLLTKRLTKGGSRAPQDPPLATPLGRVQKEWKLWPKTLQSLRLNKMAVLHCCAHKVFMQVQSVFL